MDRKLIEYFPGFLQEYKEFQIICNACQEAVESTDDRILKVLDEAFVETASKEGISRFENIVGIKTTDAESLDKRRLRIIMRMQSKYAYTYKNLKEELDSLLGCGGYLIKLANKLYTLTIRISLREKEKLEETYSYVRKVIPANLVIDIDLDYNTHKKLKKFRHKQLNKVTHYYIRNEVL